MASSAIAPSTTTVRFAAIETRVRQKFPRQQLAARVIGRGAFPMMLARHLADPGQPAPLRLTHFCNSLIHSTLLAMVEHGRAQ